MKLRDKIILGTHLVKLSSQGLIHISSEYPLQVRGMSDQETVALRQLLHKVPDNVQSTFVDHLSRLFRIHADNLLTKHIQSAENDRSVLDWLIPVNMLLKIFP